jgi:hypothetical protein
VPNGTSGAGTGNSPVPLGARRPAAVRDTILPRAKAAVRLAVTLGEVAATCLPPSQAVSIAPPLSSMTRHNAIPEARRAGTPVMPLKVPPACLQKLSPS